MFFVCVQSSWSVCGWVCFESCYHHIIITHYKLRFAESMRVRDLRSQLMKLGLGNEEVMKMLDKTELEATLARLTQHKETMEMYNDIESYWQETLMWFLMVCYENIYTVMIGFVIFLVVFVIPRDYLVGVRLFVYDYVTGYIFPIKSKVKALRKSWKYGLYFSFCCLLLAMVIEVYEMTIHITMPLGWVLPSTFLVFYSKFLSHNLVHPPLY